MSVKSTSKRTAFVDTGIVQLPSVGVQSCGQRSIPLGQHSNVVSEGLDENFGVPPALGEARVHRVEASVHRVKTTAQRYFERIDALTELLDGLGGLDIHGSDSIL